MRSMPSTSRARPVAARVGLAARAQVRKQRVSVLVGKGHHLHVHDRSRESGRDQRIGFIGAMTNLHFCESCNKLRLTCDGKLRPCLGSALEFDIMKPLRAGASDDDLRQFFLDVVERKPQQHDFRDNYQPDRKMIAIGG